MFVKSVRRTDEWKVICSGKAINHSLREQCRGRMSNIRWAWEMSMTVSTWQDWTYLETKNKRRRRREENREGVIMWKTQVVSNETNTCRVTICLPQWCVAMCPQIASLANWAMRQSLTGQQCISQTVTLKTTNFTFPDINESFYKGEKEGICF